jgi:electron transfer flavoprotein alpha/beta subunit
VSELHILVAFKVTPDFEALRDADWTALAAGGGDTRYVRRVLNCFDESALELALRLRRDLAPAGVDTRLAAVSVGGREVEPFLATLRALGYERTMRIDPGPQATGLDFAPGAVATLIAAFARRVARADLVVLGSRSGPGDGGTVPFRVAEALGLPCLSQVTELAALADGRARVTCAAPDGLLRLTLTGPCVLAVGNAVVSCLSAPTLADRLAHRDEPPAVMSAGELGVDLDAELARECAALAGFATVDRRRAATLVGGATPADAARSLYDGWLRPLLEEP